MPESVPVSLGKSSYEISFGPLDGLGPGLAGRLGTPGPCVVVTNPVVAALHLQVLLEGLGQAGWAPSVVHVPDGESAKSLAHFETLVEKILAVGIDRSTPLLALGGGVTGDLAGFAAATLLRGLPWMQVPTTLLAMVDASVGGKTAVNSLAGKNLVGAFHQPRGVWVDVEVLRTLPLEEVRCGWGEVIKHAFLEGEDAVGWLEGLSPALLAGDRGALEEVVRRCCRFKASVVEEDERETGRRAILNLGHTVGHAMEKVAGYGALGHGQAVGIGMVAEARFGVAKGWVEPGVPVRMEALLQRFGLPIRAANLSLEALQTAVIVDKKARRGTLVLPLVAAVGEACLREVPLEALKQALVLALEETS